MSGFIFINIRKNFSISWCGIKLNHSIEDDMKYYTGVGSRDTPSDVLELMMKVARKLAMQGWVLRSGGAGGADTAFLRGAIDAGGVYENYVAWKGFSKEFTEILPDYEKSLNVLSSVENLNPRIYSRSLKDSVLRLHSRNVNQVLGMNLSTPSKFVILYAPEDGINKVTGGTNTAYQVAKQFDIPVFNLYKSVDRSRLELFL
ncbi:hypothetical protein ACEV6Q_04065 [Enterobacter ludwigii]|uniref:hypothetical protein n=1 Tax=Enterobacter ludwigii TaxID=299767 RepID=UPI003BEED399